MTKSNVILSILYSGVIKNFFKTKINSKTLISRPRL